MLLTDARCMRITSRNGSRLMYQPGQAPPGITFDPRLVSAKAFFVGSVAGTSAGHDSAMREDWRYASPHMMAVKQEESWGPASALYGRPAAMSRAPRLA